MTYKNLLILLFILSLNSCKRTVTNSTNNMKEVTTYYLIRHAEKDRSDPRDKDPALTEQGLLRAIKWSEVFKNIDLDAIYSTNYSRTMQTALPTAKAKNLEIQSYDPKSIDMQMLDASYKGKKILIVGHSNTTPMLVNQLLHSKKYSDIDDSENGCLFIVTIHDSIITDQLLIIN